MSLFIMNITQVTCFLSIIYTLRRKFYLTVLVSHVFVYTDYCTSNLSSKFYSSICNFCHILLTLLTDNCFFFSIEFVLVPVHFKLTWNQPFWPRSTWSGLTNPLPWIHISITRYSFSIQSMCIVQFVMQLFLWKNNCVSVNNTCSVCGIKCKFNAPFVCIC